MDCPDLHPEADTPDRGKPRVLIASSSPSWREEVAEALEEPGIELAESSTARDALSLVAGEEPGVSAVVIDATLCDASGLGLCRSIRESAAGHETPVLIVSSLSSETDRILAFENGADDFVAYPFFARELASRVRAVLRRTARFVPSAPSREPGRFGPLRIDVPRAEVSVDGVRVRLTLREFEVLQTLVEREGRVVTREELMVGSSASSPASLRVVDTHVKALRRKLGRVRHCIETVRGVGYRFSGGELRDD